MAVRPKKQSLRLLFVALSTLPVVVAQELPKSDPQRACDAAQAQQELNQCAGEQYRKADARLNAIYRKALASMRSDLSDAQKQNDRDQINWTQQRIHKLRASERAWVTYRDLHCDAARYENEGGSMSPMVWGFCMAQTTLDRIEELKSAYEVGDQKLE